MRRVLLEGSATTIWKTPSASPRPLFASLTRFPSCESLSERRIVERLVETQSRRVVGEDQEEKSGALQMLCAVLDGQKEVRRREEDRANHTIRRNYSEPTDEYFTLMLDADKRGDCGLVGRSSVRGFRRLSSRAKCTVPVTSNSPSRRRRPIARFCLLYFIPHLIAYIHKPACATKIHGCYRCWIPF